jgi:hypothetical protein
MKILLKNPGYSALRSWALESKARDHDLVRFNKLLSSEVYYKGNFMRTIARFDASATDANHHFPFAPAEAGAQTYIVLVLCLAPGSPLSR